MSGGRLLIHGASGHGKVVRDTAQASGIWSEYLFFDDRWPALTSCGTWSVVGTGESLLARAAEGGKGFVAIGSAASRLAWLERFRSAGIPLATLIHPSAVISPYAQVGEGALVVAGAVINVDARLGIGCIVNTAATVDHDCLLGDGVHVCPGAHLAGDVQVGRASWIGIGSVVLQGVRIGAEVMVGAGAVVVSDVPDGQTVVGVPARPLKKKRG